MHEGVNDTGFTHSAQIDVDILPGAVLAQDIPEELPRSAANELAPVVSSQAMVNNRSNLPVAVEDEEQTCCNWLLTSQDSYSTSQASNNVALVRTCSENSLDYCTCHIDHNDFFDVSDDDVLILCCGEYRILSEKCVCAA